MAVIWIAKEIGPALIKITLFVGIIAAVSFFFFPEHCKSLLDKATGQNTRGLDMDDNENNRQVYIY